jgi:hypothetical protein
MSVKVAVDSGRRPCAQQIVAARLPSRTEAITPIIFDRRARDARLEHVVTDGAIEMDDTLAEAVRNKPGIVAPCGRSGCRRRRGRRRRIGRQHRSGSRRQLLHTSRRSLNMGV